MTEPLMAEEAKARQRAQVIWDVRSGKKTATEGAALLGISRQRYYDWEHRALAGMAEALLDREAGRPENPPEDSEKEKLRRRLAELEREVELLRQSAAVRDVLSPFPEWRPKPSDSEKKGRK